jgi:hypothetical protein
MSIDLTDFLQIKESFLAFLNDSRNLYKYRTYHIEDIKNSTENDMEDQLLLFILIIITEKGKCRYHDNTGYESSNERSTILESQKLLKKIKPSIISEINKILNFEKNNTYEKNISLCGCIFNIKFDLVSDINEVNLYPTILQNLFEIKYLKQLNKLPIENNLQRVISYLDCFRLYKYVSISD